MVGRSSHTRHKVIGKFTNRGAHSSVYAAAIDLARGKATSPADKEAGAD